jgi:hypothetical protein
VPPSPRADRRKRPRFTRSFEQQAGLHLARQRRMRRPMAFHATVMLLLTIFRPPARAQEAPREATGSHVRPDVTMRDIVHDAVRVSPAVRDLVDRLDRSDVVVYVRARHDTSSTFNGRLNFLSATPHLRYVIVELPCGRIEWEQIAMLGHEFRHAVEIADAHDVVDARTLAAYYQRIGMLISPPTANARTFETRAAIATARQVWRELFEAPRRSADGY